MVPALGVAPFVAYAAVQKLAPVNSEPETQAVTNPSTKTKLPYDKDGYTDLQRLYKKGDLEKITKFLAENPNVNINQKNKYGTQTLMSIAIDAKNDELVEFTAKMENYRPYRLTKDNSNDLHRLAYDNYTDIVIKLIKKYPKGINMRNNRGDTLMTIAIDKENRDLVYAIAEIDEYNPTLCENIDLHELEAAGYEDLVNKYKEKYPDVDMNEYSTRREYATYSNLETRIRRNGRSFKFLERSPFIKT